jgi:hypothetical protein
MVISSSIAGRVPSHMPPDSGRIRCVCEHDEDDGFTIQCEQCLVWQHAKCVGISKNSVPEEYFCEQCNPSLHEDLHNLALQAINLDLISTTPSNLMDVNILEDSVGVNGLSPSLPARGSFKRKIAMPPGVPALNEVTENIISTEARSFVETFLRGINVERLKRQQLSHELNFEFQSTVIMESLDQLARLQKNLEVREIKNRGYQKKGSSTRYGLFSLEQCDPGHFVCEFIGNLQQKNILTVKGAKEFPVTVTQSYVLYPLASVDLAVDARKFGNACRYTRRSCRPNVHVKPVIVEGPNGAFSLSWGLFARNIIKSGGEILLPLDYQCGNVLFRYECACGAPEFCLGPLDNFLSANYSNSSATATASTAATTTSTINTAMRESSPKPSESAELEALGIRRSSSAIIQDSNAGPTVRPILDTRKLSREERKLQKYIEYFEKMDSADAAKKVHVSHSHSHSSLMGSTSSRKGSSSGSSPQPQQHGSSRVSSPEKVGGLKKAWKRLFSSSGEDYEDGNELAMPAVDGSVNEESPAKSATSVKRGRKPNAVKATKSRSEVSTDLSASIDSADETPLVASSSPLKPKAKKPSDNKRKKDSASAKMVDIEDEYDSTEDIDIGLETGNSVSTAESSKKARVSKPKKKKTLEAAQEVEDKKEYAVTRHEESKPLDESSIIDIERSSSAVSTLMEVNPAVSSEPQIPSLPDTPSKKKLSLSDYLKKKKASPAESVPLNFDDDTTANTSDIISSTNDRENDSRNSGQYNFLQNSVLDSSTKERERFDEYSSGVSSYSRSGHLENSGISSYSRSGHLENSGISSSSHSRNIDDFTHERDFNHRSAGPTSSFKVMNDSEHYGNHSKSVDSHKSLSSTTAEYSHLRSQSHESIAPYSTTTTSTTNIPTSSRHERDKEFDRLQREREFERREAERERERERERFKEREKERLRNRDSGDVNTSNRDYSRIDPHQNYPLSEREFSQYDESIPHHSHTHTHGHGHGHSYNNNNRPSSQPFRPPSHYNRSFNGPNNDPYHQDEQYHHSHQQQQQHGYNRYHRPPNFRGRGRGGRGMGDHPHPYNNRR